MKRLPLLVAVTILVLLVSLPLVHAQNDELSGEITILWWHNLDGYEEDPINYQPQYGPPYVMLQEWKEMHPNVTVNLISHPIDGTQYQYITTQLIADTLPDLVMAWPAGELAEFLNAPENHELLYELSADLEQPNVYGTAERWRDEFPLDVSRGQGNIPFEPGSIYFLGNYATGSPGSVVFYYNKDMFEEAGIEGRIETWADLMEASEKLAAAGHTAYYADASQACCTIRWAFDWGMDQMMDGVATGMLDALNPDHCLDSLSCFGITDEMRAWAVTKGVWRADDPQYLEFVRMMKDWSQYWNEDWVAPEVGDANGAHYWYPGRVAIIQDGIWNLRKHRGAEARDFEFGTFAFPQITEESTSLATGAPVKRHGGIGTGGAANSFFIPATTVEHGTLPIVLDYLQYITTAEAHQRFCDWQYPPCVAPGQTIEDVLPDDPVTLEQIYGFFNPPMSVDTAVRYLDSPASDTFYRLFVQYATDEITLEEFGSRLQDEFVRSAERMIVENPQWDAANWPEP
jgi:ABC-type glycerol-3-phosphate transport system substrate-binding protein